MNKSELLRKYTLVKSGNYTDIRAEALNFGGFYVGRNEVESRSVEGKSRRQR